VKLIAAHIDGVDARRAAFQKRLGEAARGRAYIEAGQAGRREAEVVESRDKLVCASCDILSGGGDLNWRARGDFKSCLPSSFSLQPYGSALDKVLSFRARRSETELNKEEIESHFL
jgi:hypothetical protein